MSDEEQIDFNLSLASDQQLIDELQRRASAGENRAMILAFSRPTQDSPGRGDGFISIAGQDPQLLQQLAATVAQKFNMRAASDGRVEVPKIEMTEDGRMVQQANKESAGAQASTLPALGKQAVLTTPDGIFKWLTSFPGIMAVCGDQTGEMVVFIREQVVFHLLQQNGFSSIPIQIDDCEPICVRFRSPNQQVALVYTRQPGADMARMQFDFSEG